MQVTMHDKQLAVWYNIHMVAIGLAMNWPLMCLNNKGNKPCYHGDSYQNFVVYGM